MKGGTTGCRDEPAARPRSEGRMPEREGASPGGHPIKFEKAPEVAMSQGPFLFRTY